MATTVTRPILQPLNIPSQPLPFSRYPLHPPSHSPLNPFSPLTLTTLVIRREVQAAAHGHAAIARHGAAGGARHEGGPGRHYHPAIGLGFPGDGGDGDDDDDDEEDEEDEDDYYVQV